MTPQVKAAELVDRLSALRAEKPVGNAVLDELAKGRLTVDHLRGLVLSEAQAHEAELVFYGMGMARYPHRPAVQLFTRLAELVANATPKLTACAHALGLTDAQLRRRVPDPRIHAFNGCASWIAARGSQTCMALAMHTDMTVYFRDCLKLVAGIRESSLTVPEEVISYYEGTAEDELLSLALDVVDDGLKRGDDPDDAVFSARLLEANIGEVWRSAVESWA
ncbi:hypothetical protein G3I59_25100 [Amycolatopsis rubida]|uniref:Uncharacterized protein n=1 Tax=Amycolatopsis rubida TaxID=112413 RepID=A0A1I5VJC2_9PSEU|nr:MULTISPECIES: hypothetical protein [Amycolatopsis]MYW93798.1 hypothetical protein [Amycolatopsis rubida]NEC58788.1 hypothetical protein [Amycolatopsis rubida]OAP22987.1 hypothetical protein A4R44_06449 [Amycolatopsis sp. M39]SFQ07570.1 hypothetical protein SAMN05421854_108379 [Amycolatopsis rubida]